MKNVILLINLFFTCVFVCCMTFCQLFLVIAVNYYFSDFSNALKLLIHPHIHAVSLTAFFVCRGYPKFGSDSDIKYPNRI